MTYLFGALAFVLVTVGSYATDPNAQWVTNTDPCSSQCLYYGQVCPIQTFAPTGPGYDCNRGYCRLPNQQQCSRVPRNAHFAQNTDACQSLCQYAAGCPIRPFAPMPAGFDCDAGYCRQTPNGQCIRTICAARQF